MSSNTKSTLLYSFTLTSSPRAHTNQQGPIHLSSCPFPILQPPHPYFCQIDSDATPLIPSVPFQTFSLHSHSFCTANMALPVASMGGNTAKIY